MQLAPTLPSPNKQGTTKLSLGPVERWIVTIACVAFLGGGFKAYNRLDSMADDSSDMKQDIRLISERIPERLAERLAVIESKLARPTP